MRVTTETLEEFLECLDNDPNVFQNAIRISVIKKPLDNKTRLDASRFEILLQASAVVLVDDVSQYLLETGIYCGKDYYDASEEKQGTEQAEKYKQQIRNYAERKALKVLPGMIDF